VVGESSPGEIIAQLAAIDQAEAQFGLSEANLMPTESASLREDVMSP
jgi:hypothetical protein